MKKVSNFKQFCVLAVAALGCFPAASASVGKLYKWVDEDGQIRYGDHIPAQYADKSNERLSKHGFVVNTTDAAKTVEQLAEDERLAEIADQQEQARLDSALRDRVLLDTFMNEEAMILTRGGKIEAIEANIRLTNARIEKLKQKLAELNRRAADMERSGKPVPSHLTKQINEARGQIEHNLAYIKNRQQDKKIIGEQFEADIRRFRELKAEAAVAEQ